MALLSVQPGFSCPNAALWRPLPACLPFFPPLLPSFLLFFPPSLPPFLSSFLPPSLPYITEYRHDGKTVETEELASLSARLEETKSSLVFSKNTNSVLYSSIKKRDSPMGCLCYKHYQKLQFVQKINTTSHFTFPKQKMKKLLINSSVCVGLGSLEVWATVIS